MRKFYFNKPANLHFKYLGTNYKVLSVKFISLGKFSTKKYLLQFNTIFIKSSCGSGENGNKKNRKLVVKTIL